MTQKNLMHFALNRTFLVSLLCPTLTQERHRTPRYIAAVLVSGARWCRKHHRVQHSHVAIVRLVFIRFVLEGSQALFFLLPHIMFKEKPTQQPARRPVPLRAVFP